MGEVLGLRFEERESGDHAGIDAWVLQVTDPRTLLTVAHWDAPCYTIVGNELIVPCGDSPAVEFSRHHALPCEIRGRQVDTDEAARFKALPKWLKHVTPLATKGGAPVWAMRDGKGHPMHFVSLPVPELKEGEPLFKYFFGGQFVSLLPLFLFLKHLTEDQSWEPPPLHACFMFDDPNLHWPTYGFVDFAQMKQHAKSQGHHVSFATIPLDAWYVHSPTARIFQNSKELSLLIHGNNHISLEFARPYSDGEYHRMLRQALLRIANLEQRSGVEVSRVMVPPHGACSESVLREMAKVGFEAACISRWSLYHYNGEASWLRGFGMIPADVIAGTTVIPRFRMSPTCHNSILVAALLRQPIIPMGHHLDVADGIQLLGDLAEFVNSLGNVQWAEMKRISRYHYARKHDGKILRLMMFTKRIEIPVPEGIDQILVERAWLGKGGYEPLKWRVQGEASEWNTQQPDEPICARSGETIEIVSSHSIARSIDNHTSIGLHLWPLVRRQLAEARDRLTPLVTRVSRVSKSLNRR